MSPSRSSTSGTCALCERSRPLTFHHLIPRSLHSNKWFKKRFERTELNRGLEICRDCHGAIHRFASEKELGREWNTKERLLEHPEIGKFVRWLRGRESTGRVRTRR